MRKGDTVFYTSGRNVIRAKVLVAHRDGSAKVEAMFFVADGGKDSGPYLGYAYELGAGDIHINALAADQAILASRAAESSLRFDSASRAREDASALGEGLMPAITFTLKGPIAEKIVRQFAVSYATATIQSALPFGLMIDAPWTRMNGQRDSANRKSWEAAIEAIRRDNRDALKALLEELPDVPVLDWPRKPWPTSIKPDDFYPLYSRKRVSDAAEAFADQVWRFVVAAQREKA